MPGVDDCPPVSPGQTHCQHLDTLMWTRLAYELACRRIVELEAQVQQQPPRLFHPEVSA